MPLAAGQSALLPPARPAPAEARGLSQSLNILSLCGGAFQHSEAAYHVPPPGVGNPTGPIVNAP